MCRRIFKEQTSERGDIPFYKIGTFGAVADAFISKELFEEYKLKYPYPKKGDILISASGSIGRTVEFTGKNEYFQDSNIVWLNHDERLSNTFLKCFYSVVKWTGIEGSTIKRLYNDNILNTVINLPSIHEQNKIGAYFAKIDNLITLHQRKIQLYNRFMTIVWEQRKLGELASIYDGVHKTPNYKDSGIMFLSVENIITLKSKKYISEEDFERDYKVHPERGDIFMTRIGDVGTTNVVESSEKLAFYVSLALLKPIDSYPYFLNNAMKTNDFQMKLRKRTLVTAIPQKINKDEIGKLELFITYNFVEQKKIGDYFRKLDQLITLHQWKWYFFDKKVGNAWEQRKLGDVIPIITDYVAAGSFADIAKHVNYKSKPSYAQLVRTIDLKHNFKSNDSIYVDKEAFEYLYRVNLNVESIVLPNIGANIGEVYYIDPSKFPFPRNVLGPNAIYLIPNENIKFIYSFFQTKEFQKEIFVNVASSGQPKFNKTELKRITISLPKSKEQKCIGLYFQYLDNLITLHQWKWFVYGKIRGIVWIQRKSIKILVIQRKYTLLRVVIVFEWFIICCVCFENIQLRFIAVIEFKIFCIIVDEYVVLIVIECIYVIVVFEVYYALLEFVLIIKSCYVFDDGLFL